MTNEKIVEMLKDEIFRIEQSKKYANPNSIIVTVTLEADLFLKMAYLFVGINGNK